MTTEDFAALHAAALRMDPGLTLDAVAAALGVTSRTIAGWETASPPKDLTRAEARAVCEIFRPSLLEGRLRDMCDRTFAAIPSEVVSLWLVDREDCVLLPGGARYHDLATGTRRRIDTAICVAPLVIESLTTCPLRGGEGINLAGDAIAHHEAKKYKGNRAAHFLQGGICESLLQEGAFTPSARGPQPVLLLSLENMLDDRGRVVVPGEGQTTLFTESDARTASLLAEEFMDDLLADMRLLGMIV